MPNAIRQGDANVVGGVALGGAATVFINNRNVMIPNQSVTSHPCCGSPGCGSHCNAQTQGGSSTVFVENRPVIHVNDIDTCGHKRADSSPNVCVGE
jgi:hypothetical protein